MQNNNQDASSPEILIKYLRSFNYFKSISPDQRKENTGGFKQNLESLVSYGETVVESLIDVLCDQRSSFMSRQGIAWVLGEIADQRAIPALIESMFRGDDITHDEIVAMGTSSHSGYGLGVRNIEVLNQNRKKFFSKNVAELAAEALVKIGEASIEPMLQALIHVGNFPKFNRDELSAFAHLIIFESLPQFGEAVIDPIINTIPKKEFSGDTSTYKKEKEGKTHYSEKILSDRKEIEYGFTWVLRHTSLFEEFIKILGQLKGALVVQELSRILADLDVVPGKMRTALQLLKEIGDPASVELIMGIRYKYPQLVWETIKGFDGLMVDHLKLLDTLPTDLNHEDENIICCALFILGKTCDPAVLPEIIKKVNHEKISVQACAVSALANFKQPQAVQVLLDKLAKRKKTETVEEDIVLALGTIADPLAVQPLTKLFYKNTTNLRLKHLKYIFSEKEPDWIMKAYLQDQIRIINVLGQIKDPVSEKSLKDILKKTDDELIREAILQNIEGLKT